jgi:hypothetical protein
MPLSSEPLKNERRAAVRRFPLRAALPGGQQVSMEINLKRTERAILNEIFGCVDQLNEIMLNHGGKSGHNGAATG